MSKFLIIGAVVAVLALVFWQKGGTPSQNVEGEDVVVAERVGEAKSFNLVGSNFEYNLNEIRVKKGDTVTINFSVEEGMHDWKVDEFGVATEIIEVGETSRISFVADTVGTFEYYCSIGQHRANGMVGNLIVEE